MTKKVQIRGAIVDAWFDHAFFADEINNGILTPVTRFRADLADALKEDGDEAEIEINSTGGDVFAGAEMLAAIQDAGERVSRVVVGGLAASMAANIALMAGRPLAVHTNSLLYFHSATSETWGGPGAHADEAAMLSKINSPMMDSLVAHGVPEDRVLEGFEDGRNLVLDAHDAARYLGAEIIGAEAAAPAKPDEAAVARIQHPAADLDRLADYTATLRHVARLAAWTPDIPEPPAADADSDAHEERAPEGFSADVHGGGGAVPSSEETPAEATPTDPAEAAPLGGESDGATTVAETGADAEGEDAGTPPAPPADEPPHTDTAPPQEPEAPARPAPAEAPADTKASAAADETARALASLEKQLRAVQSGAAKKIASLTARAESAERERDGALARLAEITQRADALAASLDAERNARAELAGNVLAPEADQELPASATPHSDRLASLRTVDERLAYLSAHRAEIAAERARTK